MVVEVVIVDSGNVLGICVLDTFPITSPCSEFYDAPTPFSPPCTPVETGGAAVGIKFTKFIKGPRSTFSRDSNEENSCEMDS